MASKLSHRVLVGWSALALAAGCGQILGISNYEIDPSLDTAVGGQGAGGETGHAGTKNTGGSKPGDGGQSTSEAGAAGEPVNVGNGGAAGAGGAGPMGPFIGCDGTPFEGNEAIVRSCILRVSCQPWLYPSDTISRCVSQNAQNTYEGTKCTLDATSCDDITACEGGHIEKEFCIGKPAKDPLTQLPPQYCNGNEVVTCGSYPHARDCSKYGGTCYDFGVELGTSGTTVDCALDAVTDCVATTDVEACSDGYKYQCQDTIAYGTQCSNFAASCDVSGGNVGCYYPSNTCATAGVTCANERATWCDGSTKATFDCGSVGLGCDTSGDYQTDNNRQCLAPGCTSDDIVNCQESCSGANLTLCYGGVPVTVNCKDYGFKTCGEYVYDDCSGFGMNDCVNSTDSISFAQCE